MQLTVESPSDLSRLATRFVSPFGTLPRLLNENVGTTVEKGDEDEDEELKKKADSVIFRAMRGGGDSHNCAGRA